MKKDIAFLIMLTLIFSVMTTIIIYLTNPNYTKSDDKVQIVATLFPQYDFAKQIGGDKVNVTLILPPGTESHTYEPTPQDMVKIDESDLFIYTGEEMEPWASKLISGMKSNIDVIDLSTTVKLIKIEEDDEDTEDEHEHHHSYDPHIWLNPLYAIEMIENIENKLCEIDPENAEYYKKNANEYIKRIEQLDSEFEYTVNSSSIKKIAFGGAFAYEYFIERYGLDFASAYETCGESAEPSTSKIKQVADYMKNNNIPVIFYKEYTNGKIAKTISEITGAEMLEFNTVHNVSKEEIQNGATYVSIMKQNLENLKKALN